MSYGLIYTSQFYDHFDNSVGFYIYKKDYTGDTSTLVAQSANLYYNYDNIYAPIISLSVDLNIVNNFKNFYTLDTLLRNEGQEYKCDVYRNNETLFTGFLETDLIEEPFYKNGVLKLKFVDNLKRLQDLKDVSILNNIGTKNTLLSIIGNILNETGLELPLYVNSNFYHVTHNKNVDNTFLEQTYVDIDSFYTNNEDTYDCYKIIEDLLKPFRCYLFQYKGSWTIERYDDRLDSSRNWAYFNNAYFNASNYYLEYSGTNATEYTSTNFHYTSFPETDSSTTYIQLYSTLIPLCAYKIILDN